MSFILKWELLECNKNNWVCMSCRQHWVWLNECSPMCEPTVAVSPSLALKSLCSICPGKCRCCSLQSGSTKQNNPISVEMGFSCQQDRGVSPAVKCLLNLCFRLRCLVKQLERGEASLTDLKKNLEYAASVLESVYIEETRWDNSGSTCGNDYRQVSFTGNNGARLTKGMDEDH